MQVTRMPYLQNVNGIYRVRVEVPDALQRRLPPPHTGKKNLTKALGTGNEKDANRLAVPWVAEFLAVIDRTRILGDLADIDHLNLPEQIQRAPAALDRLLRMFPNLPTPPAKTPAEPVSFERMIERWGKAKGKRTRHSMETICGRFVEFLGHDNMAIVTFQNGRDWRDGMIEGELASGTIAVYLKMVKRLFTYAFENELISSNPMSRVKYSPGQGEERDDFSHDERRRILISAREADSHIKWCNWICIFHGCRTNEIADATTRDVQFVEGFWVFNITTRNRSREQRLKTPVSTRSIALHQAVIDEGFVEFVHSLPPGPLFASVRPDTYGRRAGTITPELSRWLRNVVGIGDPRKPFYSHRHTATSYLRNTLSPNGTPMVKEDVERFIMGHAKKGSHSGYGKHWCETLKRAVEVIPNPLA